jgi:alanine-synthesizing transaminase
MIDSAYQAMLDGETWYSPSSGTEMAIESVKEEAKRKSIKNIQDIFMSLGSGEAIELVLTALLDTGDNILTPHPGYPLYSSVQAKLNIEENNYFLDEENGWMPDPDDIRKKINSKTKGIVIINPNNPTGSLCSREILEEIVNIADQHNLLILADEIYDKIIFDKQKHISIASINENIPVITFNGISKSYCSPGIRMGWAIASGPKNVLSNLLEAVNKLLRARICACTPFMPMVKAALEGPQEYTIDFVNKVSLRRDLTYKMLNDIEGISCIKPQATFYAFPKLTKESNDTDFVKGLIMEKGVVVVPGSGFGQKPGTSHFRVVFLPEEKILQDSYNDIRDFINKRRTG